MGRQRAPSPRADEQPLDAIGRDQREAIERDTKQASARAGWALRRRGLALAVTAVVLALAGGTAGARALISGITGIPVVDDVLKLREGRRDRSMQEVQDYGDLIGGPHVAPELRPAVGSKPSEPVLVPWGSGGRPALALAYRAQSGEFCFVVSQPAASGGAPAAENFVTCQAAKLVYRALETTAAMRAVVSTAPRALVGGYASTDARDIQVRGPHGPLSVRISATWKPPGRSSQPMRLFVAFGATFLDPVAKASDARIEDDPFRYQIRTRLKDGQTVKAQP